MERTPTPPTPWNPSASRKSGAAAPMPTPIVCSGLPRQEATRRLPRRRNRQHATHPCPMSSCACHPAWQDLHAAMPCPSQTVPLRSHPMTFSICHVLHSCQHSGLADAAVVLRETSSPVPAPIAAAAAARVAEIAAAAESAARLSYTTGAAPTAEAAAEAEASPPRQAERRCRLSKGRSPCSRYRRGQCQLRARPLAKKIRETGVEKHQHLRRDRHYLSIAAAR